MLKVGFNRHFQAGISVLVFVLLSASAQAQVFTSTPVEEGTYGTPYIYNVGTFSLTPVTITLDTSIPAWMEFEDHGDGTATLSGTPDEVGLLPTITLRVTSTILPVTTTQDINLDVAKAVLTATADDKTRVYGHADPAFTISYTGFKFVTDDATDIDTPPTVGTTATSTSGVGDHPIAVDLDDALDNHYTFTAVDGTLEITPAPLTITAENKTKVYGQINPIFTAIYSGFQGSDNPSVFSPVLTFDVGGVGQTTGVGNYTITPSAGAANYTITFVTGILAITQAPLIVTAENKTKVYGQLNPIFSVTYSAFQGSDNSSVFLPGGISFDAGGAGQTSGVGNYTITPSGVAANYAITFVTGILSITPAPLTVTAENKTKVYGQLNPIFTATFSGFQGSDNSSVFLPGGLAFEPGGAGQTSGVGNYTITPSGVAANYSITFVTGILSITQAPLIVTAENKTKIYGELNPIFTATFSGFQGSDNSSVFLPGGLAFDPSGAGQSTGVGNYTITPSGVAANYSITFVTGILSITQAPLIVTAENKTKAYGQLNPIFTATFSGFQGSDDPSVFLPGGLAFNPGGAGQFSGVGNYTITPSGVATNYSITFVTGILSITPAALTVTAENKTKVYGQINPIFTATYSGFQGSDNSSVFLPGGLAFDPGGAGQSTGVGNYTITPSGVAANYTITFVTGILSITPAALTVTAENKTKVYGQINPIFTATFSGFQGSDNSSVFLPGGLAFDAGGAGQASGVGNYTITPSGVAANYNITFVTGTLSITRAALTVTAENKTKVYGQVNPIFTATFSGFQGSDDPSVFLPAGLAFNVGTVDQFTGVGNYTITPSGVTANYSVTFMTGILSITPAALTITAENKTKVYGQINPIFTATYSGFQGSDSPAVFSPVLSFNAGGATQTSGVGNYTITPSAGASNYTITFVTGILSITPAALTITAQNKTKVYGQINPIFTATYSGFQGSDGPSVFSPILTFDVGGVGPTTGVGNYTITPSAGAANYSITFVTGTLSITPASLTITADNKTKVYGQANPILTISYTGFQGSDNSSVFTNQPTISLPPGVDNTSIVGSYTITVAGATANNYAITHVNGTLFITRAALNVRADDKTRQYGATNPAFTLTYTGFVGTDGPGGIDTPPTMKTDAVSATPVGNSAIYFLTVGADNNYSLNLIPGTLSITKALLTARPDNTSRMYGAINPIFTVTYTGFANSETATVIDVKASTETGAGSNSPVGPYDIDASDASDDNYDFTYVPGILTVTKAPLTLTAVNQSRPYGAANPPLTINYTGFQNGETSAVLDGPVPPFTSTSAGPTSPVGPYTITITAGIDNNYAYTVVNGTLTVTRATLTVTANNQTRPFNTANPNPFTLSYSGFLNGDNTSVFDPPTYSAPTGSTTALVNSPVGNYTINVSGGSTANYTLAYVSGTLTITKATPIVSWATPAAITYGTPLGTGQLNATATVGGTFDYTPVSGTILNAGNGQVLSVNFAPSDPNNYNPVNGTTVMINVNKATPVITWANPAAITYGTALNTTNQLNAAANVDGAFVYNPAAGVVLNAGVNQTLSANFTPAPDQQNNYNSVLNIQRLITVNKATPIVTWANPAPIVYGTQLGPVQQNSTFSIPGLPTGPVYIPAAGTVLSAGANQAISVNWTPHPDYQANYNSVNGTTVLITVLKATPVITWPSPADITYGTALGPAQLNPTSSVGGSFTFNPPASTVLLAGSGQTLTATFTPSPANAPNYNVVTGITTTINVLKANPVITWPSPAPITYGTALGGTQLNATVGGGLAGSQVYVPPSTTVLNAGPNQTLTFTFTPTDPNYNPIVTTRTITVNKATPVITWPNPAAITYGMPLELGVQLNVSANVPGDTDYDPDPNTILNAGANQTLTATFTPGDGANYNTVTNIQRLITVNKATPIVSWATPLPIKTGVALTSTQLNATASVAGSLTYTPNAGTSFATEGVYTLHVAFAPTPILAVNYNNVPDTQVQLTVSSKENPVVTWADPAAITYGTLLSASQLNATANVAGTYDYTPLNPVGTLLNAGANQTLTVTFRPTDQVNYNNVVQTAHINVNKKTLTATAVSTSRNYGASNPSFTINYTGFVGTETSSVINTVPTATCVAIGSDPAGSTFAIIPAGGADNNYQFTYVNGTLTITKAPLIATAENKSREYGLVNPIFTIAYAGFVNGDGEGSITPPTAAPLTAVNVGTYTITLTGGTAANYNITLQTGTLTITKALLVVIGNDLTKVYGDLNPPLTFRYIGFRNGDTEGIFVPGTPPNVPPTASTTAGTMSGIGTYGVNIAGGTAMNYTLTPFPGTLTITKAPLTAKADNKSRPYGSANPPNSITYTGFKGPDGPGSITQPTITGPAATTTSDVDTYPIQLSGGAATNYDLTLQNGSLTVTKATLVAKADNKSRLYGQNNPNPFTITYTGFLNGNNVSHITPPTGSTLATPNSAVGAYAITVAGGFATNYSFTYQNGTLTVDPAPLIARANDRTRMYGQDNPNPFTISYTGFLNGDDATDDADFTPPIAGTAATPLSATGTYAITPTGGSADNYTLTLQSGTLTIAKATLTAKADDKTKVYGTASPIPSISYTGFVNGDGVGAITTIPTISGPGTSTTTNSPVDSYAINLSGGSATNYTFVLQNGALTITKAPLTAKADNQSRPYGGTNPNPFTITYTGFVAGDTPASITQPAASTVADATSNAGTYAITLAGTTTNYNFTFQSGTLTVTKRTVTVTADNRTRNYGADNPPLTMSYSGLVNSETSAVIDTPPTATTIATTASAIGNYPITLSGGSDNNYLFTYAPGTLTVSKAPLTAKADDKIRFYGDPNPPHTITYTGFVNGNGPSSITQPVASTTATAASPLGDYPIVLTGGSATNYTITLQTGTLSVIPALLTVTAVNQAKTYGAPNPTLTLNYSGFTNGQTVADIDVLPVATTTANVASNVGTYTINVSGGADPNYTFFYASGALTISKAPLTATVNNTTTTYGTIPPPAITYTGFVNAETEAVIDTPPVVSSGGNATSGPGTYSLLIANGSDNNYAITHVSGTLTINKATLDVIGDNKVRITGVPNPPLTISYTGFMNGETTTVLDALPEISTTATLASVAGVYPITVSGGGDNNYEFQYQYGELTIVLDGPPVARNFELEIDEDQEYPFSVATFQPNVIDDPNGTIASIKVVSLPQHGVLFKSSGLVVAGDVIPVTDGILQTFRYLPHNNYIGTDNFSWNLSDGNFVSASNASVSFKIRPVNDPPVLTNIEPEAILYSPGDPETQLTNSLIVNDIDDSFVWSATVSITSNFTNGDMLKADVTGTTIVVHYDELKGELQLTGKEGRANYEAVLHKVKFISPVSASATISDKNISIVVRDSIATSNAAERIVSITEVLPELDIVNAFTPNGDGVNDTWDVLNLQTYSEIDIRVFDSHGNMVYKCIGNVCEWDGTFKERALPAGPYLYSINLNNGKRKYAGIVTILR